MGLDPGLLQVSTEQSERESIAMFAAWRQYQRVNVALLQDNETVREICRAFINGWLHYRNAKMRGSV